MEEPGFHPGDRGERRVSPEGHAPNHEILMDTPWLLMSWDGTHRCVVAEWKAFATHSEFQGALMKAVEALADRKADGFVNDIRKLESVNDEDRRWLRQTWAPLALAAGAKRIAVVAARYGLARFAIDEMHGESRDPILDWRIFTTMSDALEWIAGERPGASR